MTNGCWGAWRVPARIAGREVRRHPWRSLLVVVLLLLPALSTMVGFSALSTSRALEEHRHRLGFAGFDALVSVELGADPSAAPADPEAQVQLLRTSIAADGDGATEVVTQHRRLDWLAAGTPDGGEPSRRERTTGVGVWDLADGTLDGLVVVRRGRLPQAPAEAALSSTAARSLGVAVGEVVWSAATRSAFTIVGIADQRSGSSHLLTVASRGLDAYWAAPLPEERPWDHLPFNVSTPGQVGTSVAFVDLDKISPAPSPDRGRSALTVELAAVPDVTASRLTEAAALLQDPAAARDDQYHQADRAKDDRVGLALATAVAAAAGVVASAAFTLGARRQLRQVGLLATAGAAPAVIRRSLVLQGTLSALLATALAGGCTLAGVIAANRGNLADRWTGVFDTPLALSPRGLVLGAGVTLLSGTLAALLPSRGILRQPVLSALAGRRALPALRLRTPVLGVVVFGTGLATLLWWTRADAADAERADLLLYAGVAQLAAATMLFAPLLVVGAARLAPRVPDTGRLALRSLARGRGQAAAAVAAIAVVVAVPVGLATLHQLDAVRVATEQDRILRSVSSLNVRVLPEDAERTLEATRRWAGPEAVFAQAHTVRPCPGSEEPLPLLVVENVEALGAFLSREDLALLGRGQMLPPTLPCTDLWAFYERQPTSPRLEALVGRVIVDTGTERWTAAQLDDEDGSLVEYTVLLPRPIEQVDLRPLREELGISLAPRQMTWEVATGDRSALSWFNGEPSIFPSGYQEAPRAPIPPVLFAAAAIPVFLVIGVILLLRRDDGAEDRRLALAVGAPPSRIRRLASLEGTILCTLGTAVGSVLGWALVTVIKIGRATDPYGGRTSLPDSADLYLIVPERSVYLAALVPLSIIAVVLLGGACLLRDRRRQDLVLSAT